MGFLNCGEILSTAFQEATNLSLGAYHSLHESYNQELHTNSLPPHLLQTLLLTTQLLTTNFHPDIFQQIASIRTQHRTLQVRGLGPGDTEEVTRRWWKEYRQALVEVVSGNVEQEGMEEVAGSLAEEVVGIARGELELVVSAEGDLQRQGYLREYQKTVETISKLPLACQLLTRDLERYKDQLASMATGSPEDRTALAATLLPLMSCPQPWVLELSEELFRSTWESLPHHLPTLPELTFLLKSLQSKDLEDRLQEGLLSGLAQLLELETVRNAPRLVTAILESLEAYIGEAQDADYQEALFPTP